MKDEFTREWIINNSKQILQQYAGGITVRQLHYRLVAIGMTNDIQHYKRVVSAMTKARWDGRISFEDFLDRERTTFGDTPYDETELDNEIDKAFENIKIWMEYYHLNKWENQPNYIEVWIEKKALQGVFETPCMTKSVRLAPCKGYPSLTFLNDAYNRFTRAEHHDKDLHLLYFGDYDPSGSNIPISLEENLNKMGINVNVHRIALNPEQIEEMGLAGVPPKLTDSRTRNWDGTSAVELDAVEPNTLERMCRRAVSQYFDQDLYGELMERQAEEKQEYQRRLRDKVKNMDFEDDDEDGEEENNNRD